MAENGFAWWRARLRRTFDQVDVVRLDHFRGFAGYWSVPAGAETAREGEWRTGPGAALFEALARDGGVSDLVAEDLGVITPDVVELRKRFDLPGMKILQFGFGELDSPHAPHRHDQHSVVYTGTHDNDTTRGWFESLDPESRERLLEYLGTDGSDVVWDLVRTAHESVAKTAIVPVQDLLALGGEARFNTPGLAGGNWSWRLESLPPSEVAARLERLTELSGRLARPHAPGPEAADAEA
jgi:4-alpha-glucanotransferase